MASHSSTRNLKRSSNRNIGWNIFSNLRKRQTLRESVHENNRCYNNGKHSESYQDITLNTINQ